MLARAISVETNGNPFFIREVLLNLLEGGQWTPDGTFDGMKIPPNLRQVITRRLARLSESTNRLLRAAAGFTGSFRLDVAARVADLDEMEALDAIDEGLAAQLVRAANGTESFDFTHALVRHTLYAELNPPRQARLHRRIAEAMEQANGIRVSETAGEIAQHYHRSAALPGAERGVPFAILAADHAERSAAFVESVGYLRTALNLLGDGDARRPRLVARLALGLAWIPSPEEAVEAATRAGDLIAQTEGREQAADFLADAADALWLSTSFACSVATYGLRFIGERRDTTWARLMVHDLQRQEAADRDFPGIPLASPERLRVGQELWKLPALNTIPQMLAAYLTFRSRDEVLTLAGDQPGALAFWAGDYRRALPLLKDRISAALERGQIGTAAWGSALIARLHAAAGDLSASMNEYGRAVALADRAQNPALLRPQVGVVPVNHVTVTGEGWELILMAIDNAIREGGAENFWLAAVQHSIVGHCAARLGRSDEALRRLELTLPAIERAPGSASNYPALLSNASAILEAIERTDHIETIERNLREKWLEPDFRYATTDARFSLALLCGLQGRFHEAAEWFDRARLVLDEEGSRPLRARVDFHEARMYLRRGAEGDSPRAARLLDAALAQFRTIGMSGWIRVAEELRPQCGREHPETAVGHRAFDDGASPVVDEVVFQNEGQYWTLSFGGAAVRMRDTRGIRYLACLVRAPGRETSCQDIAVLGGTAASDASFDAAALRAARLEQTRDLSGAGPAIDGRAKAEYRRRLSELATDLEEAERFNDTGHADRLRREIELIETQLVAAVGLGGRDRTVTSSAERARIAVRKRIKLAITQIAAHHAALGRHLSVTVKTGQLCSYRPQATATGKSLAR